MDETVTWERADGVKITFSAVKHFVDFLGDGTNLATKEEFQKLKDLQWHNEDYVITIQY